MTSPNQDGKDKAPPPLALSPAAAALKPKTGQAIAVPAESPAISETAILETGGPKGPEPTRFGDWERKGRCSDF